MKCVICNKGKMVRDTREVVHTYKGQTTTIANVGGYWCQSCNESMHTQIESDYLNSEMLAFNKEVNGASIDPNFISETRKSLKLDQRQAAELFGGGANAFSRYETGKTRPPLALVQLFKLLAKHPELISELRKDEPSRPESDERLKRRKRVFA